MTLDGWYVLWLTGQATAEEMVARHDERLTFTLMDCFSKLMEKEVRMIAVVVAVRGGYYRHHAAFLSSLSFLLPLASFPSGDHVL